ncbi:M3 family metallopeptidase [Rhodoblastus acidophilus]|uniref:M3 family metallopeptidase n=1 Tax=Candidatus Rhodoblastus alkanivorans TaxID=2954117 RepID=A0ABS9Z1L9_9HYPH|nr:M3 family metallopeptidase [Candidatus Rhodoblastus alkanivorans]MCI4678110.1 M3 family metallopeptidase [Candidatus Rhodoblastus alkanivorans]MCI4681549.1 M3 family metallopeptidase [Candidatus Rhodoblastus alkanivorans]MDI4642597.1 M3 family metallopeptidase [Rhodoblastus acidophilus]
MHAPNPLLVEWRTPFTLPPFEAIEAGHYRQAFDVALREHEREIAAIADNPATPTFENVIDALELAGKTLNRVGGVFWNLSGTDSTEELRAIEREVSPMLARHYADISLNERLFSRVAALYQNRDDLPLSGEQARLLELTYKSFVRAGAQLSGADRERFAETAERLASLEMNFAQNVLADEANYIMELEKDDLSGLPNEAKAVAAQAAQAATDRHAAHPFALTLSRSSVEPFLSYGDRRDLREDLFNAWIARGEHDGATDNRRIISEILDLRRERAQMLGYKTFADYKLEPTMAGAPAAALDLLDKVWAPARARAGAEAAALQKVADAEGANFTIAAHDWRYYAEKLRLRKYDIDQSALSAYFQLEKMIEAAFYCAERLFGLRFVSRTDLPTYHPDVRAFEVLDRDGQHLAIFFGDYYARAGKRSGAWMSNFRNQRKLGGDIRPVIVNVMNFSKPLPGTATLLSLTEATTLFHEFGHALHGMLSNVVYPSMSGTATPTDFVELPSQLFEHWALRPEILQKFALHHETGAPIPQDMIDRIIAARHFNQGFATVEYCASAYVDFLLHSRADAPEDVVGAEKEILRGVDMPSEIVMRHRTPHFSHIFAGDGYAAGYYSYLWSEALDADAFAAFEEAGDIFDPATAGRLRDYVYAAGNQRDPNEAYRLFRGRKPEFGALLLKKGLTEA